MTETVGRKQMKTNKCKQQLFIKQKSSNKFRFKFLVLKILTLPG